MLGSSSDRYSGSYEEKKDVPDRCNPHMFADHSVVFHRWKIHEKTIRVRFDASLFDQCEFLRLTRVFVSRVNKPVSDVARREQGRVLGDETDLGASPSDGYQMCDRRSGLHQFFKPIGADESRCFAHVE